MVTEVPSSPASKDSGKVPSSSGQVHKWYADFSWSQLNALTLEAPCPLELDSGVCRSD